MTRLQEVTVTDKEIVWHISPHKPTNSHFYTYKTKIKQ